MGQKVHPLGFRVGITKKHQSQWFARFNKYKYSQSLLEDRVIRDTLSKLFPELLNPILNSSGAKKRDEENSQTVTPRITQIKIERGLIPYEIGIQIHAENCELLKSAIDNLKVKRELISKLQKTRRYLLNLKLKLKDLNTNIPNEDLSNTSLTNKVGDSQILEENGRKTNSLMGSGKTKINKRRRLAKTKISAQINPKKQNFKKSFERSFRPKFSKQELRRQRLIKKRLNKRQSIRRRYRQLILKGLFIKKTGNKIIQTLSLKSKKFEKNRVNKKKTQRNFVAGQSRQTIVTTRKNTFSSRIKKKFVTLFIQKMNKRFLSHLKVLLLNYNSNFSSQSSSNNNKYLPLGYNKQWDLNRLNTLKNQPIYKLNRMVIVLEQKLLLKLESLRKEFIAFGSISAKSSESLGYFQILNFLKHLKELVSKLKREQKLQLSITKNSINTKFSNTQEIGSLTNSSFGHLNNHKLKVAQGSSTYLNLAETVLEKKLNNIENECRKVKLIEYVKDIVKKHRTENVYFYLSTMSDVSKELKKIKQFTKRHANFLFGLNLNNFNNSSIPENETTKLTVQNKITERVNKVLEKSAKKIILKKHYKIFS